MVITSHVTRAQFALGMTQKDLGEFLGSSLRTAQRWAVGRSHPSVEQLKRLAIAVYPRDASLAAEIAAAASETTESLGLTASAAPSELVTLRVQAVILAAAEALDISPRLARKALRAAFERAHDANLAVGDVREVLLAEASRSKRQKAKRRARD